MTMTFATVAKLVRTGALHADSPIRPCQAWPRPARLPRHPPSPLLLPLFLLASTSPRNPPHSPSPLLPCLILLASGSPRRLLPGYHDSLLPHLSLRPPPPSPPPPCSLCARGPLPANFNTVSRRLRDTVLVGGYFLTAFARASLARAGDNSVPMLRYLALLDREQTTNSQRRPRTRARARGRVLGCLCIQDIDQVHLALHEPPCLAHSASPVGWEESTLFLILDGRISGTRMTGHEACKSRLVPLTA